MQEQPEAKEIVEVLAKAGFVAYYAGGWVRDFLLQRPSDDIDIATNAPPETVRALFPHTVPIGIAFGIVLVVMKEHSYEVATFRQDFDYRDGRRPSRVQFSTAEEDAKRRDFTINGMFYDPLSQKVLDFVGGEQDLKKKVIRAIGNPHERIQEDRLRMIRAIRLSCRFQFEIEEKTKEAIRDHAKELFPSVAVERVWQELVKAHDFGALYPTLLNLHEVGLLQSIFPKLESLSLDEIKKRLKPVLHYPKNAPAIAFFLPLFPEESLQERIDLCLFFKLSKIEKELISFLSSAETLFQIQAEIKRSEWAYFYAHPDAEMCLQIEAAKREEKKQFLAENDKRKESLKKAIERIQNKEPLVRAEDLIKQGISPGPLMGILLKKAEEIAIQEEIETKEKVIKKLKKEPEWP